MLLSSLQSWTESLPATKPETTTHLTAVQSLAEWLRNGLDTSTSCPLIFVCTHNSRRSILGEMAWNAIAAFYGLDDQFPAYSAGTEAAQLSPHTLDALRQCGFETGEDDGQTEVRWSPDHSGRRAFSKRLGDSALPTSGFAAVMVCAEADAGCPFVPGAARRISMPVEDPKRFDQEDDPLPHYVNTLNQMAAELHYSFSLARSRSQKA